MNDAEFEFFKKINAYIEEVFEPLVIYQRMTPYEYEEDFEEDKELLEALENKKISFSEMLFKKIKEKNISEVECYKKASIDRKVFSRIRNNVKYQPKKNTMIALAIALELSIEESEELFLTAGYSLSYSFKFDIIVRYFIENEIYDLMLINSALHAFGEITLEG